jgi:Putative DNA-binding domain
MLSVDLRDLGAIQRRISALITGPDGVEAALASADDSDAAALASLVRSDGGATAGVRLGVYSNAYFVRLHDCLRDDYGALADALGPAAFHDLVRTYLMLYPPSRPSLRHAGRELCAHLESEPFATIFGGRWPWAADLARLEWALGEAFFAADATPLAPAALATLAPDAFGALRFGASPSLGLLRLDWPVASVRERFDQADGQGQTRQHAGPDGVGACDASGHDVDGAPALERKSTSVRVWRQGESVRFKTISDVEAAALDQVIAGESFGAACETVARFVGDVEAPARAAALLAGWIGDELFVSVEARSLTQDGRGCPERRDAPLARRAREP